MKDQIEKRKKIGRRVGGTSEKKRESGANGEGETHTNEPPRKSRSHGVQRKQLRKSPQFQKQHRQKLGDTAHTKNGS